MAINLNTRYPDNTDVDPSYTVGKARNESFDGAKDYFPLEATWVNEILGFFSALLYRGGLTPNGVPETRLHSQYMDAIRGLSVSLDRLENGYKTHLIGEMGFGDPTSTNGRTSLVGIAGSGGYISSKVSSSKTYPAECRLFNGGVRYEGNTGETHNVTYVHREIPLGNVTFVPNTYNHLVLVASTTIPHVSFTIVYSSDLILLSSSEYVIFPLNAQFRNVAGDLILYQANAMSDLIPTYPIFTLAYLRIAIDPAAIS